MPPKQPRAQPSLPTNAPISAACSAKGGVKRPREASTTAPPAPTSTGSVDAKGRRPLDRMHEGGVTRGHSSAAPSATSANSALSTSNTLFDLISSEAPSKRGALSGAGAFPPQSLAEPDPEWRKYDEECIAAVMKLDDMFHTAARTLEDLTARGWPEYAILSVIGHRVLGATQDELCLRESL